MIHIKYLCSRLQYILVFTDKLMVYTSIYCNPLPVTVQYYVLGNYFLGYFNVMYYYLQFYLCYLLSKTLLCINYMKQLLHLNKYCDYLHLKCFVILDQLYLGFINFVCENINTLGYIFK